MFVRVGCKVTRVFTEKSLPHVKERQGYQYQCLEFYFFSGIASRAATRNFQHLSTVSIFTLSSGE